MATPSVLQTADNGRRWDLRIGPVANEGTTYIRPKKCSACASCAGKGLRGAERRVSVIHVTRGVRPDDPRFTRFTASGTFQTYQRTETLPFRHLHRQYYALNGRVAHGSLRTSPKWLLFIHRHGIGHFVEEAARIQTFQTDSGAVAPSTRFRQIGMRSTPFWLRRGLGLSRTHLVGMTTLKVVRETGPQLFWTQEIQSHILLGSVQPKEFPMAYQTPQ